MTRRGGTDPWTWEQYIGAVARIVLLCPNDDRHVLGCLVRLDASVEERAGREFDMGTWSDGRGNTVVQRWGRHGSLIVHASDENSAPLSIEGCCLTCTRRRLPGHSARPALSWARVIAMLDYTCAQRPTDHDFVDQRVSMRW